MLIQDNQCNHNNHKDNATNDNRYTVEIFESTKRLKASSIDRIDNRPKQLD
jgi:hypothetical protein